jgi:hypothetical protein
MLRDVTAEYVLGEDRLLTVGRPVGELVPEALGALRDDRGDLDATAQGGVRVAGEVGAQQRLDS